MSVGPLVPQSEVLANFLQEPREMWRKFGEICCRFSSFNVKGRKKNNKLILVDVSDIFYFFCSGRGRGSEAPEGGGRGQFFIENPRRGVSQGERRGGGG